MRKIAAVVALVLLLTGCTGSDIQKRLVVTAIGISENSISYQAFSPENEIEIYTFEASNLSRAAEELTLKTGKEVFLGDAELIVLSGNGDFEVALNYLWHSPDIYMGTPVAFSEAEPGKLLETNSEELTAILTVAGENVGLIDLYNAVCSSSGIAAVPLFSETGEISGEILLKSSSECGIIALYNE